MGINLKDFEFRWWSQHGEDGVLKKIFEEIPPRSKHFVEIGAHFHEANCIRLQQHDKWAGVYFDDFHEFPPLGFHKAWITAENINPTLESFHTAGLLKTLDILSIDVDGVDFHLWNALDTSWQPSVVIAECTTQLGLDDKVVQYVPNFRWDGSVYVGASSAAWLNLAKHRGYSLVHIEDSGVNMFFVRDEILPKNLFTYTNDLEALVAQTHPTCNYSEDSEGRKFLSSKQLIK